MRTIERSSAFKLDFKRAKAAPRHRNDLDSLVSTVVARLASDQVLPNKNRDHGLSGEWAGYRDCHIKPDLTRVLWIAFLEMAGESGGATGYQTLINAALREYLDGKSPRFEDELRRIIRAGLGRGCLFGACGRSRASKG